MTRRSIAVFAAFGLCLLGSVRIASTWKVFSFTIDEPAHAACGMEWLEGGKYTYEDQHPPLARVVAALGIRAAGNHWGKDPNMWWEGIRDLQGGSHRERGLIFGRAAMLPFFWIGTAAVFLWTRRIAGDIAAVCAAFLFTSLPPILGHAGLITTDMALTAFMGAATWSALPWAEKPSRLRTEFFGVVLGLTLLTKFSALPFLPCGWLLMYLAHPAPFRRVKPLLLPALYAAAVAMFVVWAAYRFDGHEFFSGIESVRTHNAEGHSSYLLGRVSLKGFWYYYPAVLAIKTPLALLVLICCACFRWRQTRQPLAFSFAILLCAAFTNINIGVRHVLPVYLGSCVAAGIVCAAMLRRPRWRIAAVALLALHFVSGAWQHPDYLAYTNEFFMRAPEAAVVDSDLDWGQDMKRLAERMKQLGVHEIYFQPFNRGYAPSGMPFPTIKPIPAGNEPPRGWTALSVTMWKLGFKPEWADRTRPAERVGRSTLLFHR